MSARAADTTGTGTSRGRPVPETPPAPPTIRTALARAAARLQTAGCDTPRLDAELMLAEVLAVDRARLVLDAHDALTVAQLSAFEASIARREAREPVAYILGRRDFRRLTLAVDRRVLIPRPETELLVEQALALPDGARVFDVGTGSGAVALALADERPDIEVWAGDVSEAALEMARGNAARLGLSVRFVHSDLLENAPADLSAVLANLPYVESDAPLAPEIAAHEPRMALFADDRGLALIRRLIDTLHGVPFVALEVGEGQAPAVTGLLAQKGYATETHRDLAGIERVVVGRR